MIPSKSALIKITTLLLCIFVASNGAASPGKSSLPISDNFSVEYVLEAGLFTIGKTRRSLSVLENGLYVFESYTWPAGMLSVFYQGDLTERSVWKYKDRLAVPIEYSYKDTNKKKERDVVLTFDWDRLVVTNNINGEPWEQDIEPGTQDKLLYQVSIMLDLTNNNRRKSLAYTVADGSKKIRYYDAKIQGKETIKTPAGKFKTIRIHRDDGKRVTTLWCAPALDYLPVRILHYKKGETKVNAYLTKVEGLPTVARNN